MIDNAGKPWCDAQDQQLLKLVRAGKSLAEVAQIMGRTHIGIAARADRLSYRVTTTDQYTLLRAFIEGARNASPAATTRATQCVTDGIEGAQLRTTGLQSCERPLPLLLEVDTEHFYLVLHALESAGFEVKSRVNKPARYVVTDTEKHGESV